MDVQVAVDSDFSATREAVLQGVVRHNERFLGPTHHAEVAVSARNDAGEIVGGAVGHVYQDRLFIDLVWVDDAYRGQGVGSRVVRGIEAVAKRHGAARVLLDTFAFQAAPFYEKLGYVEVARIPKFFGEYDRIYLEKDL